MCTGWSHSPPHLDPWPAELSPVFLEAHDLVPVGTQLTYSCLLLVLEKLRIKLPSPVFRQSPLSALILLPRGSLLATPTALWGDPIPSHTSSGQHTATSHTCTGRPPPAAPEACRKVGLLSLRSSTAMCMVPVVLRGGLPPSCTCTRSWKLLCRSRSRVWSVVTSPGSAV